MAGDFLSSEAASSSTLDIHDNKTNDQSSRPAADSNKRSQPSRPALSGATLLNFTLLTPVLVPAILLAILISHALFGGYPSVLIARPPVNCDSSGKISIVWWGLQSTSSVWNPASTLDINVGFGDMPFSTAKGIDVAWDLVVGRGVQALCAIALYYIFRGRLAEALGQHTKPYDVALALQYSTVSTSSLFSYIAYALGLAKRQRQQCFHATLLVLSVLYVLLLPTLLSAMSGYQAKTHPVLPFDNHTYVSFDELSFNCEIIIADASRVGFNDNLCVARGDGIRDVFHSYRTTWRKEESTHYNGTSLMKWYDGPSTFNSSGEIFHLESPTLHYIFAAWHPQLSTMFGYEGRGFTNDYLQEYGICQASQRYEWGFSFLLSFSTLLVTLVLFLTLEVFWWRSRSRYDATYTNSVFGQHQTAITISDLLKEEIRDAPNGEEKKQAKSEAKSRGTIWVESISQEQIEPIDDTRRGR